MYKIVKYLTISIIVTLQDVFLLIFFIEIFRIYYLIAVTTSFISAVFSKYTLNKFFIFKDRKDFWVNQLSRFAGVSTSGLITTNLIMYIGVDIFSIHYIVVKIVAIVFVFFLTFTLHNLFSFKSNEKNTVS
ncbi:MAG: GtrA family protein [Candidatus Hodarchaeota archaeon]